MDDNGRNTPRAMTRQLGVVLAIGLALRFWNLDSQSLSMDEVEELKLAASSVVNITQEPNSFPPFYHFVLHVWLQLCDSELAARWLSVVFGMLHIAAGYQLARTWTDRRTGVLAATLIALSPFEIFYSQQGRGYSMFAFLVTLTCWLFVRAVRRPNVWNWLAFVTTSTLGVYTHYYFAVFLALTPVLLLVDQSARTSWRRALPAYAVIGLLCLPCSVLLHRDFVFQRDLRDPRPFDVAAFGYTYFSFVTGYSIGPGKRELHEISTTRALALVWPWALLLGTSLAVPSIRAWQALRRHGALAAVLVSLLGPVVLIGLASRSTGLTYNVRHLCWVTGPLAIFLAAGFSSRRWTWKLRLAAGVMLLICAVALYNRNYVDRYRNEDVRSLLGMLAERSSDKDPLLVTSFYMARPIRFCLDDPRDVIELPRVGDRDEALQECLDLIDEQAAGTGSFWLIYSRPFHGDPHGRLLRTLLVRKRIRHIESFAGITVYRGRDDGTLTSTEW